ncbi:MAG: YceI family protein [Methylococcaceae bacterium]|nr:MAG: YceI family protein [Methylococcaceae bacterium]
MKNLCRHVLPLAGLLLAGAPFHTQAAEFNRVQTGKSTLAFAYKQMGVPMEGSFHKFTARIAFDPARADAAQARFEVDPASIDTGFGEADSEVLGKQWFDTKAYPAAQFVSTGVKALGGNRYEVLGKFTLKGKSRDISAPFTFKQEGSVGVFDGAFTLNRLDYAIGEGAWSDPSAVANEIQVKFHIVADAVSAKK